MMTTYERRKAVGICPRCGIKPAQAGAICCAECAIKRRDELRALRAKRRAEGIKVKRKPPLEVLLKKLNLKCPSPCEDCGDNMDGMCCCFCEEKDECSEVCLNKPQVCGILKGIEIA